MSGHVTYTASAKRERRDRIRARDCVRARAGISEHQALPALSDFGSLPYNNFNNPGPQLRRD